MNIWGWIGGFIVFLIVAGLVAGWITLSRWQRCIIYRPKRYTRSEFVDHIKAFHTTGLQCKELFYPTSYGNQRAYHAAAVHISAVLDLPKVWLFFGGNSSLALEWRYIVSQLEPSPNHHYLFIEYPGYGKNNGAASPDAILESTHSALVSLSHKCGLGGRVWPLAPFGVIGHSLGCATALQWIADATEALAERHLRVAEKRRPAQLVMAVDRVVLLAPFVSVLDMTHHYVGRFPGLSYLLQHPYDNANCLRRIANCVYGQDCRPSSSFSSSALMSITVLHGDHDKVIPIEMGHTLVEQFRRHLKSLEGHDRAGLIGCRFVRFRGVGHSAIVQRSLPYLKSILSS